MCKGFLGESLVLYEKETVMESTVFFRIVSFHNGSLHYENVFCFVIGVPGHLGRRLLCVVMDFHQ